MWWVSLVLSGVGIADQDGQPDLLLPVLHPPSSGFC